MKNFSGMLSFRVKGGEAEGAEVATRMAARLRVIHHAVSLGHHRTLVCWMPTASLIETSFRLEGAQAAAYRDWAGEGIFRLSVGLEDAADLIRDLDQAL